MGLPQYFPVFSSVQLLSRVQLFVTAWMVAHQLPHPSPVPGACSNSCPFSQRCHPTISSSVGPFSSCLQSFPASGSFLMSQLFTSGGQSIGASASVLPMNIQGSSFKNELEGSGTFLVVQLRVRLPMQGTQVRSLVRELRSHRLWCNKPTHRN